MTRTTVDLDRKALEGAQRALGTSGLSATVNEALRKVGRERVLAGFDIIADIDGTPDEVAAHREERGGAEGSRP